MGFGLDSLLTALTGQSRSDSTSFSLPTSRGLAGVAGRGEVMADVLEFAVDTGGLLVDIVGSVCDNEMADMPAVAMLARWMGVTTGAEDTAVSGGFLLNGATMAWGTFLI